MTSSRHKAVAPSTTDSPLLFYLNVVSSPSHVHPYHDLKLYSITASIPGRHTHNIAASSTSMPSDQHCKAAKAARRRQTGSRSNPTPERNHQCHRNTVRICKRRCCVIPVSNAHVLMSTHVNRQLEPAAPV